MLTQAVNRHLCCKAGKIRFSGTGKSVLLKPNSGERCAPRNFVLLVTLGDTPCDIGRYTCSPHRVPRRAPNEIDYVKTNSRTTVSTRTT